MRKRQFPFSTPHQSKCQEVLSEELLDPEVDFICDNDEESIRQMFSEIVSNREELFIRKHKQDSYIGNNSVAIHKFQEWIEA